MPASQKSVTHWRNWCAWCERCLTRKQKWKQPGAGDQLPASLGGRMNPAINSCACDPGWQADSSPAPAMASSEGGKNLVVTRLISNGNQSLLTSAATVVQEPRVMRSPANNHVIYHYLTLKTAVGGTAKYPVHAKSNAGTAHGLQRPTSPSQCRRGCGQRLLRLRMARFQGLFLRLFANRITPKRQFTVGAVRFSGFGFMPDAP